jgi:hypothetical protein
MEEINKIIFQGYVVDSDDPLRLGRLRIIPEMENVNDIKQNITPACKDDSDIETNVKKKCKWTKDDPFVILPLLPYTVNITPKEGELVHIIYPVVQDGKSQSRKYADRARFYLPASPSTPLSVNYENKTASKTNLSSGDNLKPQKNLKEVGGRIQESTFGIFPEPEDNSLLGRGTADLILKDDTALLRAGKSKDMVGPTTKLPTSNEKRAFLQLTDFTTNQSQQEKTSSLSINFEYNQLVLLVEWHILNPENEFGIFSGYINLYNVQKNIVDKLNTKNFKVDTDVESIKGAPLPVSINFVSKPFEEVLNIFNSFINGLNEGKIFVSGYTQTPFVPTQGKQFPFAFRPSPATYKKFIEQGPNPLSEVFETANLARFYQGIGLNRGSKERGFGIITAKNTSGAPITIKKPTYRPIKTETEGISYGMLGAQKVYIYSHDSQVGTKKPSLKNTIYGINQPKFLELEDSTEPMVRGQKLMDLISLVVRFLTAHVHPYHGVPPVPVASDGTQSAEILQKLLDAPNTILNENIRIN